VNKPRKKLSDFAREQGMAYISVYKLWQQGFIEGVQLPTGTILVSDWKKDESEGKPRAILYARVATPKQKLLLENQIKSIEEYALRKNYQVVEIVEETGYGFTGNRQKMLEILERTDWDVLVVDNKEVPIKFGFDYLVAALASSGRSIDFQNNLESDSDNVLNSLFSNMNSLLKSLYVVGQKRHIESSIDRIAS
jgi:putative resolvase